MIFIIIQDAEMSRAPSFRKYELSLCPHQPNHLTALVSVPGASLSTVRTVDRCTISPYVMNVRPHHPTPNPLLFNVFFAALHVVLVRFSLDGAIVRDLV